MLVKETWVRADLGQDQCGQEVFWMNVMGWKTIFGQDHFNGAYSWRTEFHWRVSSRCNDEVKE